MMAGVKHKPSISGRVALNQIIPLGIAVAATIALVASGVVEKLMPDRFATTLGQFLMNLWNLPVGWILAILVWVAICIFTHDLADSSEETWRESIAKDIKEIKEELKRRDT
jgi:hypothetical protein